MTQSIPRPAPPLTKPPLATRPSAKPTAAALTTATAAAAAIATIAGLGGRRWPVLDLATHFRLHGLLALTPGLALAIARRQPRRALALGVPWLISAASVARYARGTRGTRRRAAAIPAADARDVLRIAIYNVWGINPTPQRIAPYLEASGADIAVIVELRPPLAERLADPSTWSFVPVVTAPRDDFYGVGLYVRRDAAARGIAVTGGHVAVVLPDDPRQRPAVQATVTWAGRSATLIGTHPPLPKGAALTRLRDRMLAAVAGRLVASGRPGILVGDINAAPWSSARHAIARVAALDDAASGHGYRGTWPSLLPRWLGIPIDVCLIDPRLAATAMHVGPGRGSDHRPLIATLVWR